MTGPRRRGATVRTKLALSYAGFVVVAGLVLTAVLLLVLRYIPDETLVVSDGGGFAPDRSDLLGVALPLSVLGLAVLAVVGLAGGWVLAGRMLRPVTAIGDAARVAAGGSLSHRIALAGPDDELRRLADTVDDMLSRLERAFSEQRRFTANASHELRTPLTVVKSLLEVARADPAGRDVDVLLARLHETNERSIAMVESLLHLAHAERDDVPRARFDLADVVRGALAGVDGDVEVVTLLDAAPVVGNRALVEQLVRNLVQNAARHNLPVAGTVWVGVGVEDGRALLTVANTGDDVPAGAVATLTEPFVRVADRTRQRGRRGSGLGLAIVAAIARAHRAELDLAPRAGGGLEVTVRFAP